MINDFTYEQESNQLVRISEGSSSGKGIIENTLKFEDLTIQLGELRNQSKSSNGSGEKKSKDSQAYASSKDSKKKEMLSGDVDLC